MFPPRWRSIWSRWPASSQINSVAPSPHGRVANSPDNWNIRVSLSISRRTPFVAALSTTNLHLGGTICGSHQRRHATRRFVREWQRWWPSIYGHCAMMRWSSVSMRRPPCNRVRAYMRHVLPSLDGRIRSSTSIHAMERSICGLGLTPARDGSRSNAMHASGSTNSSPSWPIWMRRFPRRSPPCI